jgi:hypothetical protein
LKVAAGFQPAVSGQPGGAWPLEGGLGKGCVRRFMQPGSHTSGGRRFIPGLSRVGIGQAPRHVEAVAFGPVVVHRRDLEGLAEHHRQSGAAGCLFEVARAGDLEGHVVSIDGDPLHDARLLHHHRMHEAVFGTALAGHVHGDGGIRWRARQARVMLPSRAATQS